MNPQIINTYDQCKAAGGARIVIFRRARETGRGSRSPAWQVGLYKDGKQYATNPGAAWYDYGMKTFMFSTRAEVKPTLKKAIEWAVSIYGPREFVPNRMGDYVEKEVQQKFPIPIHPSDVRCKKCGKKREDHQSGTHHCPVGSRTRIGFCGFHSEQVFES